MEQKTKKSISRFGAAWDRLAATVKVTPKAKKVSAKKEKHEKHSDKAPSFFTRFFGYVKKPLLVGAVATAALGGGTYLYKNISMPKVHVEKVAKDWMKGAAGQKPVVQKNSGHQKKVAWKTSKQHKQAYVARKGKHSKHMVRAKGGSKSYQKKSVHLAKKHGKYGNLPKKERLADAKRAKKARLAHEKKSKRTQAKRHYASYGRD
jgi:hypothetical protein